MATAHFFNSYPSTRGLSPFNPYIKNVELKSSYHSEVPKQYGQNPHTIRGPESIKNPYIISRSRNNTGKTSKTLTLFRGPEAIRAKQSFRSPETIRAKRQNPHFIRGPETGIQSPGTLSIFPHRGFL